MTKTLVCLGGGVEAVQIIQRALELGHRAIVVDIDPDAPGLAVEQVIRLTGVSCYHAPEVIDALYKFQVSPDGVLCCAVDAPIVAAKVAQAFGLPGLTVEAAMLSQDKLLQIKTLEYANLPIPELYDLTQKQWVVVKPADSRGGRGVHRLRKGQDLREPMDCAETFSPTRRVLLLEWLDGLQLSTESIVQDGQVLFTAVALRNYARLDEFAPYVIEDGCDAPYGDAALVDECSRLMERACHALGWYQQGAGTVKGDLVIHDGKVHIIELAARLSGGFLCSHIIPGAYGVDLVGYAIQAALGQTLSPWSPAYDRPHFVSQRYVFPEPVDLGRKVVDLPALNGRPFATWNLKPGQTIQAVDCHPLRWGQMTVSAGSRAEAEAMAVVEVERMKKGVVLA